ncbi:hypothetical protein [Streptomyces sp. NPDC005799]|uniref:hypothetical protein n=1 Tax=Streptomyces sp. NPDC005799 TaxID=3154678 RepID=UPI0033F747EF
MIFLPDSGFPSRHGGEFRLRGQPHDPHVARKESGEGAHRPSVHVDGTAGRRLRKRGIRLAETRSTALFQLAGELPAGVLARPLGTDIAVAAVAAVATEEESRQCPGRRER